MSFYAVENSLFMVQCTVTIRAVSAATAANDGIPCKNDSICFFGFR